jgi:hypothetical protein
MVAATLRGPEVRAFEPSMQIDDEAYRVIARLDGTPDAEWLKLFSVAVREAFDEVADPAAELTRTEIRFDVPSIALVSDYAQRMLRTVALTNQRQRDRQRDVADAADRRNRKHKELVELLAGVNQKIEADRA